jgi:hypothetical protein
LWHHSCVSRMWLTGSYFGQVVIASVQKFAGYYSLFLIFDPLYVAWVSGTVTKWANKNTGKTFTNQHCNILLLACIQWKWSSSWRVVSRVRENSRRIISPFPTKEKEFTVLHNNNIYFFLIGVQFRTFAPWKHYNQFGLCQRFIVLFPVLFLNFPILAARCLSRPQSAVVS